MTAQQPRRATLAVGLSGFALVLAATSLALHLRHQDPAVRPPEPSALEPDLAANSVAPLPGLRQLSARIDRLEQRGNGDLPVATATEVTPEPLRSQAPTQSNSSGMRELTARVALLEAQQRRTRKHSKGLAAPESIASTLAVLLASRGVITKPGDIEAIQANMATLGSLVADNTADDWDRIEAYRGMLTFGFESPEECVAAMQPLASMLLTSTEAKARASAATMLQTYKNPAIASTLMAAYSREQDAEARAAIVQAMLQLVADPGIRQSLETASKREQDPKLKKRIRSALGK